MEMFHIVCSCPVNKTLFMLNLLCVSCHQMDERFIISVVHNTSVLVAGKHLKYCKMGFTWAYTPLVYFSKHRGVRVSSIKS